jgi:hypothetical protein
MPIKRDAMPIKRDVVPIAARRYADRPRRHADESTYVHKKISDWSFQQLRTQFFILFLCFSRPF